MKLKFLIYGFVLLPFVADAQTAAYRQKADALVAKMTTEEKALLLSGDGWWQTNGIKRLGIPAIFLTDGPNGLRKSVTNGLGESVRATCFPTASALSATWNVDLLNKVGVALAEESQANDVQILLGPGTNMKRSPLGGRNFEYFSEDPLLAGKIAASYIRGVQSQGVGTSLKHFAVNNQEFERMANSSNLDERTLHEIYLPAFEIAVKEGKPWTLMASYNKINGLYASQNPMLLTDILRTDWGFKGFVMSDWGAVDDRVAGINAGLNLEMPGSGEVNRTRIIEAIKTGKISTATLNNSVAEFLTIILEAHDRSGKIKSFDAEKHNALAREAGSEGIVLLKNEQQILPLTSKTQKIAFIGAFAKTPRYQGAGSSQVNPIRISNAFDEFEKLTGNKLTYAQGYDQEGQTSPAMLAEAVNAAQKADVVVVFAGLPDSYESEGFDRTSLDMPSGHNQLVDAVTSVNKNVVVVLMNGSAITMPWLNKVNAVVEGWLGGQAGGGAIADVLSGKVNPSGKLSETFAQKLADTPTSLEFPGLNQQANYGEGIFIGYRYYDKRGVTPMFPFGYGLSYTTFAYTDLQVDKSSLTDADSLTVSVKVKNTGKVAGKQVVELYVGGTDSTVVRPVKELKAFSKLSLQPGEEKTTVFKLGKRDFSYYSAQIHNWTFNSGTYYVMTGASSGDITLKKAIQVTNTHQVERQLTRTSMIKEFKNNSKGKAFYPQLLKAMGLDLDGASNKKLTAEEQLAKKKSELMLMAFLNDLPVYKLVNFSAGKFSEQMLTDILKQVQ